MILREIVQALERVEERQELILKRLEALESEGGGKAPDEWIQRGLDNILGYQAGKGKEEGP